MKVATLEYIAEVGPHPNVISWIWQRLRDGKYVSNVENLKREIYVCISV